MPGRDVPEIVPTQRVQPGQPRCPAMILIGVPAPEGVAPALGHIRLHAPRHPEVSSRSSTPKHCARLNYSPQPRRYRLSRATSAGRLTPAVQRVSCSTWSRKWAAAFGVM